MPRLFDALTIRDITFRNRIFMSPMCMYSSVNGMPNQWHEVHLTSRAIGGAGLILVEASAVSMEGRITPADSGMWSQQHAEAYRPIIAAMKQFGAVPGIQIAHAGRKASTDVPWNGGGPLDEEHGGWTTLGPSPIGFAGNPAPREMTAGDIDMVIEQFASSAEYARSAGFEVVEIHMAHGYLLHEFLSPLANRRTDDYGGSLENRMRFPLKVAEAVRDIWPGTLPLFVRISATDWADGGWDLQQSVEFCRQLKAIGVDLIDCSSGGLIPHAKIQLGPGYQVAFAHTIRELADIATAAVGLITDPHQAEQVVLSGQADAVLLARALLRDPYWPWHAARTLGAKAQWPVQYQRAAD